MKSTDLKSWRIAHGLSYRGAAKALGYSRHYIINIEKGRQVMTATVAARMGLWDEQQPYRSTLVHPASNTNVVEGAAVLRSSCECACGCKSHFVPGSWNQAYLPGHRKHRRAALRGEEET